MSSSDDDMPLAGSRKPNGTNGGAFPYQQVTVTDGVALFEVLSCPSSHTHLIFLPSDISYDLVTPPLSSSKIPSNVDATMDRQIPTNGEVMPGISMAHGDVKMEDAPRKESNDHLVNGATAAKRKVRESLTRPSYAEAESSDEDLPLVCDRSHLYLYCIKEHVG